MNESETIRRAVARVAALRSEAKQSEKLKMATAAIKRFQSLRFSGTYTDLLQSEAFGTATRFFLSELYSEKDYSERDAQFARIANALQRLFPQKVIGTAVALAELHVLSEELDYAMALAWMQTDEILASDEERYLAAWKKVNHRADRTQQLELVLQIGNALDRLTRTPGLRLMLKMMRRPARTAGLGALQNFLESGFDTFATMSKRGARSMEFLNTIRERELHLMDQLFSPQDSLGASALRRQFQANVTAV